ncbi:alcohol dehydrogenase catalytic domain-containing protein [Halocalculus aciditolerans]|uniref:Alcohol dehydrogenase n=1 Tax=Halocalculus aciditolerans TaxID=1383812 RepID=A0A830F0X7_9EURY|nr:alcohol dehydrogenase catalytic domain-containing protein [Halocalculus aciditolerans]GGL51797.1 alcohol dehydrogenase [Halocalculus aciditolerans]
MLAAQVPDAGDAFDVVEKPVPEPGEDEVRVAVDACGVCHSDEITKEGLRPGIEYPRVPGHEVVGRVDAVGENVTEWSAGDRVGVGWHGGHCFTCDACREGNFIACENAEVTGISFDGGYAEYTVAPREALAAVPDSLDAADAAPLLCAGITTFNALRNADARPGDLVAVVGVGGLGHLGLQYAREAGFETAAVSRGREKEASAREFGADHYIDSENEDPAEELQELGGADVVLATAPAAESIEQVVGGLGTDGEVVAVGIPEDAVDVHVGQLVGIRGSVGGWASGTATDSEDTLDFSALRDITPEIETFDLEDAADAYAHMIEGDVRFRAVIQP